MVNVNVMDVQNGTYMQLGKVVGIVETVNSDSNVNVSIYMSECEKYVSEFKQWSKKTAQMVLEMCRVVYEAKQVLSKEEFKKFSSEINARSTITKYLAIGAKYEQLYQYADLLPHAWTSIYDITQMPSATFEALVATEHSLAKITGAQLKLLMGKKTEGKSKSSVTTAAALTTTAPQTAQNTSQQPEIADQSLSQSDLPGAAAVSSDAIQNVSREPVSESTDTANDDTSSESDHEFAKKATNTMLERVTANASTTVEIDVEEDFEPYEVTIRFNKMPSDEAKLELAEYVYKVKNKYRLDIEVLSNYDEV